MSRRGNVKKRPVPPDPVYNSTLLSMTIRRVMRSGKKSLASSIVYNALASVGEKTGEDPLEVFEKAIKNLTPLVEVKARRVGGATYQVPMEVRPARGTALALRWLVHFPVLGVVAPWKANWLTKLWMPPMKPVPPSKSGKKPTAWPKPTRPLPITATRQ